MTTDPSLDAPVLPDAAPTLPPAAPPIPPAAPPVPPAAPAPTLPPAVPVVAQPVESQAFDAKAMVEATTRKVDDPPYGGLPAATPEGLEASRQLRAKARGKRQRNRLVAWVVVAVFVGGIAGAGWFAYRAYQDDQDRQAAERESAAEGDEAGIVPGALTPLGNQQQVIDALDDINSSDAQLSGGGLRDIVDQAQDAVDDANGVPAGAAPIEPLVETVFPAAAGAAATRLDDAIGFERYLVSVDDWSAANPTGYLMWLDSMAAQPQLGASSPVFDMMPPVKRGQVGVALRRDADVLVRAVVVGLDPDIHVDIR